jgi:hypothetical protein
VSSLDGGYSVTKLRLSNQSVSLLADCKDYILCSFLHVIVFPLQRPNCQLVPEKVSIEVDGFVINETLSTADAVGAK